MPFFRFVQRGVAGVQRSDGLHHAGYHHVELRRDGDDLHPLEGSPIPPAGVPHRDQRLDGPCLHQVHARLDDMGCAGCHGRLG